MKFVSDPSDALNVIHATTRDSVSINGQPYRSSVLVPCDAPVQAWPASQLSELTEDHFLQILPFKPELVIFGSGPALRFVHPRLMQGLMAQRIGVETMDTQAACRTYNILVSEGRKVLAALLIHS